MLLTIEKLIYGGDGLARLPADERGRGKAVFVPFVLAQETVEAILTQQKPGFVRANATAILEPSPHRVQPQCPYFAHCGGCHYQHASYEHQLQVKADILRENLRRIAKLELQSEIVVHPSPPWNYRNRSRLQVRTAQPEFTAGYFKHSSHEVLPVEECPISSPLINRGISALWQAGNAGKVPGEVHEIEFFANESDTGMLVALSCAPDVKASPLKTFCEQLRDLRPEIGAVAAFREPRPTPAPATKPDVLSGEGFLLYQANGVSYQVSAGSFFQTNRHLTDELVKIVVGGKSGELAIDLYAGVGLFSTALACNFHHTVCVESSQSACHDLKYNLPANGEVIWAKTEQYLSGYSGSGQRNAAAFGKKAPELVVVDPPRAGLGESSARSLASVGAPRVTYVSCDPATLARDLVPLLAAGYRVEQAHLIDLFPQTYHLETVVELVR